MEMVLGHPAMVEKLGISVETLLENLAPVGDGKADMGVKVGALATARGVVAHPEPMAALLTDGVPEVMMAPGMEYTDRIHFL